MDTSHHPPQTNIRCKNLTRVEKSIIARLESGPVESLYQLAYFDLGIAYWWAWQVINRLEACGMITTRRQPGRPMIIELRGPDE